MPSGEGRGKAWWREHAPLALILLAALCIRCGAGRGVGGFWDSFLYARSSLQIVEGTYGPSSVHHLRLGFVIPQALIIRLLGYTDLAFAVLPLVSSLFSVALAYVAGRRWCSPAAGVWAGWIHAVVPLDVIHATVPNVDGPAASLMSAAGVLLMDAVVVGRCGKGGLLAAGVLAGAAWLTKEFGAFVMLLAAAGAVFRRNWGLLLWPAAGFLTVVGAEFAVLGAFTGDPLLRLRTARLDIERWWMLSGQADGRLAYRLTLAFPRIAVSPDQTEFRYFGFLFWLAAVLLWRGASRSDLRIRCLCAWIGILFLAIAYCPSSLVPYRPSSSVEARHLYPLLLPACLAIGLRMSASWKPRHRAWVGGAFFASSLCCVVLLDSWNGALLDSSRMSLKEAKTFSPRAIYAGAWDIRYGQYESRFRPQAALLDYSRRRVGDFSPGVVIENELRMEIERPLLPWRSEPHPNWRLVGVRDHPRPWQIQSLLSGGRRGRFSVRIWEIPP